MKYVFINYYKLGKGTSPNVYSTHVNSNLRFCTDTDFILRRVCARPVTCCIECCKNCLWVSDRSNVVGLKPSYIISITNDRVNDFNNSSKINDISYYHHKTNQT